MSKTCPPAILAALVLAAGCGKADMPRTYPVTGTVAFKDGEPLRGGLVEFKSTTDPTLSINGQVQEEGTFTLQTLQGKDKVPGAPEGSYKVTFLPPSAEDQRLLMLPVTLAESYQVEAKENNHFEIRIDRPPSR